MEHSREFYESVIRVIDYLNPYLTEVRYVMPDKGAELAGGYWPEIGRMFKEDLHLGWFECGRFYIGKRERLAPLRKDCEHRIEKIDKAEQDRLLANEESICNIKYGRKGFRISIVAIIISGIAILLELAKWIWPQW